MKCKNIFLYIFWGDTRQRGTGASAFLASHWSVVGIWVLWVEAQAPPAFAQVTQSTQDIQGETHTSGHSKTPRSPAFMAIAIWPARSCMPSSMGNGSTVRYGPLSHGPLSDCVQETIRNLSQQLSSIWCMEQGRQFLQSSNFPWEHWILFDCRLQSFQWSNLRSRLLNTGRHLSQSSLLGNCLRLKPV